LKKTERCGTVDKERKLLKEGTPYGQNCWH